MKEDKNDVEELVEKQFFSRAEKATALLKELERYIVFHKDK